MTKEPQPPRLPTLAEMGRLTRQQREVLALVGLCLEDRAIAKHLSRSIGVVRFHLHGIRSKLKGVHRREHLALVAVHHGLAPPLANR